MNYLLVSLGFLRTILVFVFLWLNHLYGYSKFIITQKVFTLQLWTSRTITILISRIQHIYAWQSYILPPTICRPSEATMQSNRKSMRNIRLENYKNQLYIHLLQRSKILASAWAILWTTNRNELRTTWRYNYIHE